MIAYKFNTSLNLKWFEYHYGKMYDRVCWALLGMHALTFYLHMDFIALGDKDFFFS